MHTDNFFAHQIPRRRVARRAVASFVAMATFGATGLAVAGWSTTGDGRAYAKAANAKPLRTVSSSVAATLFPGGTGDLELTVGNDNPFDVRVTEVASNGAITSGVAACDAANAVTFVTTKVDVAITKRAEQHFVVPASVSMADSAPDECKDATFTVPVRLSGAQAIPAPGNIAASAASLDLGLVRVATTATQTVELLYSDSGTGRPTKDITVSLGGTDAALFAISTDTCSGRSLAAGETCSLTLGFTPGARRSYVAQLVATAGPSTATIGLAGRGGDVVLSGRSHDFGNVPVGEVRTGSVVFTNIGEFASEAGPVFLNHGSVTPAGTYSIPAGSSCPALDPGASCTITAQYHPAVTGDHRGAVYLTAGSKQGWAFLRGMGV